MCAAWNVHCYEDRHKERIAIQLDRDTWTNVQRWTTQAAGWRSAEGAQPAEQADSATTLAGPDPDYG